MSGLEICGDEEPAELLAAVLFGAAADAEAAREELARRAEEAARWREAN